MSIRQDPDGDGYDIRNEVDNFDELFVQTVHANPVLDMTANNGSDLPPNDKQGPMTWARVTPLDGRLERNQVAELVALHVDHLGVQVHEEGSSGTTPGSGWLEMEVNHEGSDVLVDGPPVLQDGTVKDGLTNNGPANEADYVETGIYTEITKRSRLAFSQVMFNGAFNDTTNGTGGGGESGDGPRTRENFRQEYGRGPIYDSDDVIRMGGTLRWNQIENQKIEWACRIKLIWDTFEYPASGPLQETAGPDIVGD